MSDAYDIYYCFEPRPGRELLASVIENLGRRYRVGPKDGNDTASLVDRLSDPLASLRVGSDGFAVSLRIEDDPGPVDGLPAVVARIRDHVFDVRADETDEEAIDRIDRLYTLLAAIYEAFVETGSTPIYVPGFAPTEAAAAADPDNARHVAREDLAEQRLPGIFWFQIVPPAMADAFGRAELLDAPCFRSESLDDGAVLLAVNRGVRTEEPFQYGTEGVAGSLGVPWERGSL